MSQTFFCQFPMSIAKNSDCPERTYFTCVAMSCPEVVINV